MTCYQRYRHLAHLFICFIGLLLIVGTPADAAPRLPSAKRECALCHIMWLTEFKRDDVTPLIAYDPKPVEKSGRQDVSSTERMCLSCHDGFVLESRFLWKQNQHTHPIGQKPSEHIQIPIVDGKNLFPLNDDGKVYCGTCHTAHGIDWSAKDSPIFMRVRSRDGELCQACHKEKTTGPAQGNHPIKEKPVVRPGFLETTRAQLSNDNTVTCQSCHSAHGAASKEKILVTENLDSQLCRNCHEDRHASDLTQAAAKKTHPVNIVPRQAKIPETLLTAGAKQGSKGQLICQTCHSPHDSKTQHGILVKDNKDSQLCRSCHNKQQQVAGGKHDMRLSNRQAVNIRGETVDKGGTCSACHLPHDGEGPKMWARKLPPNTEPMAAVCLSCHSKKGLASKHGVGEYSHPVGFAMGKAGENIKLPGFSLDGVKFDNAANGSVTCASCHDAHQWDPNQTLQSVSSETEGDASNSFLRIRNNQDSKLCRTCHKQQLYIVGSEHDLTETAPDSVNALNQKPSQAGICGSCHHVHNGLGPRMWARKLPPGIEPAAANCVSCHNPDGIAKEKAIDQHSHPVGVSIDNIGIKATLDKWVSRFPAPLGLKAPQPLPLYDERGHSLSGGQEIGCGTCHDPHRWSPDSTLAKTDVEGDAGSSFLRIADHGNSELCINCHADKSIVKHSKHGAKDLSINGKSKAGPCSNCHQPHQTKGAFLWARDTGSGEAPVEKLCTSCHRDGGTAKKKLTGDFSHPIGIELADHMKDPSLPLFKPGSIERSKQGKIDCTTCHDPHQWDPADMNSLAGSGKKVEGDANTSFLRVSAGENSELCIRCHTRQQTVLKTDHDMSVSQPRATNTKRQTVTESGVCGQCHSIHNASDSFRLWAQETSRGQNRNERLCLSCHSKNSIAANKVPAATSHPPDVHVWSGPSREALRPQAQAHLPVFDNNGEASKTGIISCPSCHDPHQWRAGATAAGPGYNSEGDTQNSFLRLTDTRAFVCADCHGLDSIYRYKYFHSQKSHQKHSLFR